MLLVLILFAVTRLCTYIIARRPLTVGVTDSMLAAIQVQLKTNIKVWSEA